MWIYRRGKTQTQHAEKLVTVMFRLSRRADVSYMNPHETWLLIPDEKPELLHASNLSTDAKLASLYPEAETLCREGVQLTLAAPAVFERLTVQRCPECCRITGIHEGEGSPRNDRAARETLGITPSPSYYHTKP